MTLDSLGVPVSSHGPYKKGAGDAALLCGWREGRATSRGSGTSKSWKRQELMLPWSLWWD